MRIGLLHRILPDRTLGSATMMVLTSYQKRMLRSVRTLLDHLAQEIPKIMAV